MCPVVVTKAEYDKLQAAIYKGRNRGNTYKLSQSHPEPRFLFLKYMKNGTIRVKRLMVKNSSRVCFLVRKPKNNNLEKSDWVKLKLRQPVALPPLKTKVLTGSSLSSLSTSG